MRPALRFAGIASVVGVAAFASAQVPQAPQAPPAPPAASQCAGCHGAQGEGNSAGGFPRIAGQSQYYLSKQLGDYANGRRRNAVMEAIAKGLAPADRDTLAAYYSKSVSPAQKPPAQADAKSSDRAKTLSEAGDGRLKVQACNNCHGPNGAGEPPLFPYLAGLDANYLRSALNEWRTGGRDNDPSRQMQMIAKALAEEDLASLAQYYAAMQPPRPALAQIIPRPASGLTSRAADVVPADTGAQGGASSPGVGQGAATTGGSQGPGGSADSGSKAKR